MPDGEGVVAVVVGFDDDTNESEGLLVGKRVNGILGGRVGLILVTGISVPPVGGDGAFEPGFDVGSPTWSDDGDPVDENGCLENEGRSVMVPKVGTVDGGFPSIAPGVGTPAEEVGWFEAVGGAVAGRNEGVTGTPVGKLSSPPA